MASDETLALKPHPAQNAPTAVLMARLRTVGPRVSVEFAYEAGEPGARLHLPALAERPVRKVDLWKTTCFEIFLQPSGGAAGYLEVNFSPSSDWNVYAFDGYREGMRPESRVKNVKLESLRTNGARVDCGFALDLGAVPGFARGPIRTGVTAVIETAGGMKSYWALHHAAEKPDFHRAESFIHRLHLD